MKVIRIAPIAVSILALTACGGGGSGRGGGGTGGVLDYTPSYSDGPGDSTAASSTEGVTGVMSQADISATGSSVRLRSVRVRISADGNTAYLTVDGVTQSYPVDVIGVQYGTPGTNLVQYTGTSAPYALMTHSGASGSAGFAAFGIVGVETPEANLPAAPANYSGSWGGQVYGVSDILDSGVVGGSMDLAIDFEGGSVSGSFDGTVNAASIVDIDGSITGSVSGNGASGTMNLESGYSGSIDFAGKAYGDTGEYFGGAFAGSIGGGGHNYNATGTLLLDYVP